LNTLDTAEARIIYRSCVLLVVFATEYLPRIHHVLVRV
jgi:hypothetical protein